MKFLHCRSLQISVRNACHIINTCLHIENCSHIFHGPMGWLIHTWYGTYFHSWLHHSWKSLWNHLTRDNEISLTVTRKLFYIYFMISWNIYAIIPVMSSLSEITSNPTACLTCVQTRNKNHQISASLVHCENPSNAESVLMSLHHHEFIILWYAFYIQLIAIQNHFHDTYCDILTPR